MYYIHTSPNPPPKKKYFKLTHYPIFRVFDLVVLDVIVSFQDICEWRLFYYFLQVF